jgi:hypothetical protein
MKFTCKILTQWTKTQIQSTAIHLKSYVDILIFTHTKFFLVQMNSTSFITKQVQCWKTGELIKTHSLRMNRFYCSKFTVHFTSFT